MQKKQILFFTCAVGFHENFLIPYTYFAKKSNENAKFEYIVEDISKFKEKHQYSIEWLSLNLDVEIVLRETSECLTKPKMVNSYRFIMEPKTKADYTYIGDVDIMILENIYDVHKPVFEAGHPYSNIIRKNTQRLTGLHFVKNDAYYPLPEVNDLVSTISNDEAILYAIAKRKGILIESDINEALGVKRPLHGIHMSLNRLPFSYNSERVSWGIQYKHIEKIKEVFDTSEFSDFNKTLYKGSSSIITNLIVISEGIMSLGKSFWNNKNFVRN